MLFLCVQAAPYLGLERQVSLAQTVLAGSMVAVGMNHLRQYGLSCGFSSVSSAFPALSGLQVPERAGRFGPLERTFCKRLPWLWTTPLPHGLQGSSQLPLTRSPEVGCSPLRVGLTVLSIYFHSYTESTFFQPLPDTCLYLFINPKSLKDRNYFLLILYL